MGNDIGFRIVAITLGLTPIVLVAAVLFAK